MASRLAGCALLAGALTLVAGCDPNGPLAPVRNLTAPTAPDPAPALLGIELTVTSATSPPALRDASPVGEATPFQIDWRAILTALNNNVTNISFVAELTTTTGVTATGEPLDIEWLIVNNPSTVTGSFTGVAPLDDQGRIAGELEVTATGTDMGTGLPVSTTQTQEFAIDVTPAPAGCAQTSTNGCAFDRFDIFFTATNGSGTSTNGPVEQHFSDGVRFNVFDVPLLVQLQNQCGNNGHWWVSASSATDVELSLTVTDTNTGQSKIYTNPLNTAFELVTDTQAFATCP